MKHKRHLAVTLVCLALPVGAMAGTDTATAPVQKTFCGTVVKLVEGSCIGVKQSKASAPSYDITGTTPVPKIGELISGSGDTDPNPTLCMQGPHLTNVTWAKAAACPLVKKR